MGVQEKRRLDLLGMGYVCKDLPSNKPCECNFTEAHALFQHGNGFSTLDTVSVL